MTDLTRPGDGPLAYLTWRWTWHGESLIFYWGFILAMVVLGIVISLELVS